MKNKKTNKIITLGVILVLVVIAILVFALNFSKNESELTLLEKKWISDNANSVKDVMIFNDIPVYGNGGNGVVFDFLNSFTEEYDIEFNKLSYYTNSENVIYGDLAFKILEHEEDVSDSQILFYEDFYVLLGSGSTIYNYNEIDGVVGVLASDYDLILYELETSEDKIKTYENIDSLIKGYLDKEVSYLILPNVMYMEEIVANEFDILYHISNLSVKYVLDVSDENLYNIMNKFYQVFKSEYLITSFSNSFLDIYFKNSDYSEADRINYNSTVYTYGYVVNMPYENVDSDKFVGIISNYLKEFQEIANVDIQFVRYNGIEDLKTAIIVGDVDFALCNFNESSLGSSFDYTNKVITLDYVVLARDYRNVNNITGFSNDELLAVNGSRVYDLLKSKNINVIGYDNTDELLRGISDSSLVAMDKNMYLYYMDGKLGNYQVIYEDRMDSYSFVLSRKNDVFTSLFSYYVSFRDYNDIKYNYNTSIGLRDNSLLEKLMVILFSLIFGMILFIIGLIVRGKKKIKKKKDSLEDKQKFIDVMTSLKNRNYLNYSIPKWDLNVIYPQAIVVINLNGLKTINDNYGHQRGDEVIKQAANILISNQLEKTDLIRTDGNEFLIYMVGYEEADVLMYAKKIYKEFKMLPYGFGCSFGYSMIIDDVKTIDDAINEAVIDMHKNKDSENK